MLSYLRLNRLGTIPLTQSSCAQVERLRLYFKGQPPYKQSSELTSNNLGSTYNSNSFIDSPLKLNVNNFGSRQFERSSLL